MTETPVVAPRRTLSAIRPDGTTRPVERPFAPEIPVALEYNGLSYAVMMASPSDLDDFITGFALTEGLAPHVADIAGIDLAETDKGWIARATIASLALEKLQERVRTRVAESSCGLCGIDSIAEAMKPVAIVGEGIRVTPQEIMTAMQGLYPLQKLNTITRAVHAAAFWTPQSGIMEIREDVGRHNALDKLAGALARKSIAASEGAVLLTSRVSVEMVQKTASIGASLIVSVSAPTALAIRMAERAGITLAAIARADGFEIFTHMHRISPGKATHVA